jgi:hypothetical protein
MKIWLPLARLLNFPQLLFKIRQKGNEITEGRQRPIELFKGARKTKVVRVLLLS